MGSRPAYSEAADALGRALARRGIGLVYGGARVGTMGRVATAALEAGGEVTGVIPRALVDKGGRLRGAWPDLRVVESMSQRKALMAELSDGFIALAGGYGTLDELIEMLTWTQLDFHDKPCGVLNTAGFYDSLLAFFDHTVAESFVQREHRQMVLVDRTPEGLIDQLIAYEAPRVDKARWILEREES